MKLLTGRTTWWGNYMWYVNAVAVTAIGRSPLQIQLQLHHRHQHRWLRNQNRWLCSSLASIGFKALSPPCLPVISSAATQQLYKGLPHDHDDDFAPPIHHHPCSENDHVPAATRHLRNTNDHVPPPILLESPRIRKATRYRSFCPGIACKPACRNRILCSDLSRPARSASKAARGTPSFSPGLQIHRMMAGWVVMLRFVAGNCHSSRAYL